MKPTIEKGYAERLKMIAETLGGGVANFERKCGLGNGYIDKDPRTPRSSTLKKILETFPNLNRNWLEQGTGEMYLNDENTSNIVKVESNIEAILKAKNDRIRELEDLKNYYQSEIKRLNILLKKD
jgi:hypothetical protein